MALVTHHFKGSYAPTRPVLWKHGTESKYFSATFPSVKRTDRLTSLKHRSCLCVRTPLILGSKKKPLRISSFKVSFQNDDSRASRPKSVKISFVSQESEEPSAKSPKRHNVNISCTSEANETIARSQAIQNLFKSWLTLLRTPPPKQLENDTSQKLAHEEISETKSVAQDGERGKMVMAAWRNFLALDATIKVPSVIFIPMFLAVNMKYGAKVSKELTPLWIFGPFIVALYVKMILWIFSLYVFCFKQTVKVLKNLPAYYNFVASGELKEIIRARIWQPMVDFMNLDYRELSKGKMKELQEWLVEKYLDYVESIWPFYCKTIRFLKRAHFL